MKIFLFFILFFISFNSFSSISFHFFFLVFILHTRVQPISILPHPFFYFLFLPHIQEHSGLSLSFSSSLYFSLFLFLLDSRTLSSMIFWFLFYFYFLSSSAHFTQPTWPSSIFFFFLPSFLVLIHFVVTMELR